MLWRNFINLRPYDVIKFVVGSEQDISVMKEIIEKLAKVYKKMPHIYAGAVFGQYEPKDLVETIMKEPLFKDVVFQLQIHKIIWNPEERGV